MATFYLFGSTATIDTGIMDGKLHVHCAGMFFICSIYSIFYNVIVCCFVYYHTKKITTFSITIKIVLGLLILYQYYLELFKTVGFFLRDSNSDLSHILEYTLAFSVIGYVMLFALDFRDWKLSYRKMSN